MERTPDYIVRDLMNKAADDVGAALIRTIALVEHREDKATIAAAAMSRIMIYAGIGVAMSMPGVTPGNAIRSLLSGLLPTIDMVAEREFAKAIKALGLE